MSALLTKKAADYLVHDSRKTARNVKRGCVLGARRGGSFPRSLRPILSHVGRDRGSTRQPSAPRYTVETEDHEDHTFNGIMFDVEALATRPVDAIVVDAVYVRGGLGKMTVWCSPGGFEGKRERPDQWRRHLSKACPPSWREFARLELDEPIVLKPGRA